MAVAVLDNSPEAILATLERVLAAANDFDEEFSSIEFGDWANLHVYIPEPNIQSAITPPFMEAFLVLQKQVYQLAALVKTGVADVGQLTEIDRQQLQIIVTGGSSDYLAQLRDPLTAALKRMVGKMTGKQAMIVIISLGALIAAPWSWKSWLDYSKEIKVEELNSKDHIAALQALQFANESQREAFTKVLAILEQQGDAGKRANPSEIHK